MIVFFKDNSEQEFETPSQLGINGPAIMIDLGEGSSALIPLDAIKYLRIQASRILLAQTPPPARPLQ